MPDKILELLEDQQKAFSEFMDANNTRVKALEEKKHVDPLLETKVDKINDELSRLEDLLKDIEKESKRKNLNNNDQEDQAITDHAKAFKKFIVKGVDLGLKDLEMKALNVTTDADGGFAVPEQLDRNILQIMKDESPMRQVCTVQPIGGVDYKKLVDIGGAASGWVDEDDGRTLTASPQLAQLTPFMGEIYANPAATQTMLDDAFFNAESWLAGSVAEKFAEAEGTSFISGNGTKQPKGILEYTSATTADASRTFGQLQHKVAASATAITSDELIDIVYLLRRKYRNGASFMMNGATVAAVRKMKDGNGNYLWQPSVQAGQPATVHGYNLVENEDMPDIETNEVAVMFGNFKKGYLILDRMGIRTLRDPYTNKPYVQFYSTKRVGGMLLDSLAIKLLKQA